MPATSAINIPAEPVFGQRELPETTMWVGEHEPLQPARRVAWLSAALLAIAGAVLLAI